MIHQNKEVKIAISEFAPDPETVTCSFCNKKFKSVQGYAVHVKCVHGVHSHNDDEKYKKDLQVFTQAKGVNIEVTVESIVEELICKVEDEERAEAKEKKSNRRGRNRREKHSSIFKGDI